jgi:pyruvate dehydrogenase E2 component (dihydrolipoamide acetyltransferase)
VDLALVTGTGPNGRIVEEDVKLYLESRPKASPLAIKAAEAAGVDLATVTGTGASGRIMQADVETAVRKKAAIPAEALIAESVPLTGLRRIIGERMAASHTQTARVTLITEADATASVDARESLRTTVTEEWGFAPGYNDLLGLVVARALREFPYMNARLSSDGRSIEQLPYVNLGVAVDTERGLVVPVIRDADQKGLRDFGTEFRTLAERARAGRSLPDDLTGGTFTMTNLGMYEVDAFTPIINLPEAAILGVGRIKTRPVAVNGEVCARQTMWLSLTFDHRLVDGAPAARFFQRIKQLIENPILLLEKVAESGR